MSKRDYGNLFFVSMNPKSMEIGIDLYQETSSPEDLDAFLDPNAPIEKKVLKLHRTPLAHISMTSENAKLLGAMLGDAVAEIERQRAEELKGE